MSIGLEIVQEGNLSDKELAFSVQEKLLLCKKTLAVAESCTGGYLAHCITQNAGASGYFLGSFVTYSEECKKRILQVPEDVLSLYGVVSSPVALAMLSGVFLSSSADIGAAITGIAGPEGGSKENPVGTVWIAVGVRGQSPRAYCHHLTGDRQQVIRAATRLVLLYIINNLTELKENQS